MLGFSAAHRAAFSKRGNQGLGWWDAGCTQLRSCHTRAGLPCDPWGLNSIPVCFFLGVLRGAWCLPDVAGAGYGVRGPSAGNGAVAALTRWAALWRNSLLLFILQFFRRARRLWRAGGERRPAHRLPAGMGLRKPLHSDFIALYFCRCQAPHRTSWSKQCWGKSRHPSFPFKKKRDPHTGPRLGMQLP